MTRVEKAEKALKVQTRTNSVVEQALRVYEQLFCANAGDTQEVMNRRHRQGEYSYIPLSMKHFIEELMLVESKLPADAKNLRFVDVGCGIGTKLIAVHSHFAWSSPFSHITGIEINPKYVDAARLLIQASKCNLGYHYPLGDPKTKVQVHNMDALKCTYKPFDVIYFYCPLCKPELQVKLEERILKTSKKGAFIIANLKQGCRELWEAHTKSVDNSNYVYQVI